ncbi:MAG: hypothetical protein ACI85F_003040, partial [Bacteroidia bacterium]
SGKSPRSMLPIFAICKSAAKLPIQRSIKD